jgi:hypothetical protein
MFTVMLNDKKALDHEKECLIQMMKYHQCQKAYQVEEIMIARLLILPETIYKVALKLTKSKSNHQVLNIIRRLTTEVKAGQLPHKVKADSETL